MSENYRFQKGDKVICKLGGARWEPCIIVRHNYNEEHFDEPAAYQAKQISNGQLIYAPLDDPCIIREFVTEPIEKLICAIKYDEFDDMIDIIDKYHIDIELKVKDILTAAATFGNEDALSLFEDVKIDINMVLDDTGRNIVLLATMKKQFDFIIELGEQKEGFYIHSICKLFSHRDINGYNILHYAVLVNAEQLLCDLFCDDEESIDGSIASRSFCPYWMPRYPLPTIFQNVSKNGKTAYDLAVALKRNNLADLLRDFGQQAIVENVISCLDPSQTIFSGGKAYSISECEDILVSNGVDISTIQLSRGNALRLQKCAFALAYNANIKELRWLIGKCRLDYTFQPSVSHGLFDRYPLSLEFFCRHGLQPPFLVHAAVLGPLDQYWIDDRRNEQSYLNHFQNAETFCDVMRLSFNSLFESASFEWKINSSIKDCIRNNSVLKETTDAGIEKYRYYLLPVHDSGQQATYNQFIDGIVRRIDGVKVSERIELFSYLLDELQLPPPSLATLVSLGQLHLLQWFLSRSEPMAPLHSDSQLMALRDGTAFLHGADETMPIAAFLCAYATGLGEVSIMEWLLLHFEITESRLNGLNNLHIAIVRKHSACVLWLINFIPSMLTSKTDNGSNALHLAVSSGNVFVTLRFLRNTDKDPAINELWVDDGDGKSVFSYLRESEEPELEEYIDNNAIINDIDSLVTLLTVDGKISLQSMIMFMEAVDFFAVMDEFLFNKWSQLSEFRTLIMKHTDRYHKIPEYLLDLQNDPNWAEYISLQLISKQSKSWRDDNLDITGTRYDAKPSTNWGSDSVSCAVCEVIIRCIYMRRNDVLGLILEQIQYSLMEAVETQNYFKDQFYDTSIEYARYVENEVAVILIEDFLGHLLGRTDLSKTWLAHWNELSEELHIEFIVLDLSSILRIIELQRNWLSSKPDNVYLSDFRGLSFNRLMDGHSNVYVNNQPMKPLCYAMRSDSDEIVRWLLSLPTIRGNLSMPETMDTLMDIGSIKFLKLVLDLNLGWKPENDESLGTPPDPIQRCFKGFEGANGLSVFQYLVRRVLERGGDINAYFYGQQGIYSQAMHSLFDSEYMRVVGSCAFDVIEWIISQRCLDLNLYSDTKEGLLASLISYVDRRKSYNSDISVDFQTGVNYSLKLLDLFQNYCIDFTQHARMVYSVFYELLRDCLVLRSSQRSRFLMKFILTLVEKYQLDIRHFDFLNVKNGSELTSEECEYVPLPELDRLQDCPDAPTLRIQLQSIRDAQVDRFTLFQKIKNNESIVNIRNAIQISDPSMFIVRDSEGRGLLHHAAVLGRVDILDLLYKFNLDLSAKDYLGRSVIVIAEAAGETSFAKKVRYMLAQQVLTEFCVRRWRSFVFLRGIRTQLKRRKSAATTIQSLIRRFQVYRQYGSYLREIKGSWARFKLKWARVLQVLEMKLPLQLNWSEEKANLDISYGFEDEQAAETENLYQLLTHSALLASEAADSDSIEEGSILVNQPAATSSTTPPSSIGDGSNPPAFAVAEIEISRAVLKWVNQADEKYKLLFRRRLNQLSQGLRSYALSKRLQGSDSPIYETKLDAGMRILWTPLRRVEVENSAGSQLRLFVWCVSSHDRVSRNVNYIDRSFGRMTQSPLPSDLCTQEGCMVLTEDMVLLDPFRNTPLKVHVVHPAELSRLTAPSSTWVPPIRLTQREREVNAQLGAVLLIGRSGTGKTVCVSERMIGDRETSTRSGSPLTQLFVSRSQRLCNFVQAHQRQRTSDEDLHQCDFLCLSKFVRKMETAACRALACEARVYAQFKYVSFTKFRDEIYPHVNDLTGNKRISALDASIVWTQIRSFIMGSIEASTSSPTPRPLLLEEYLNMADRRCKVTKTERAKVYKIFLRYEEYMQKHGLWDDAVRILDLLSQLKWNISDMNFTGRESSLHYDRIYVDEVQDSTQAEISLFLLAAGLKTRSLFLAGDPAQAVIEGVDFRFEEVREVVHRLSGGCESIAKPLRLERNFRSHTGILNVAAAVLEKMFDAYPESAVLLSKDSGLFNGPRPGLYEAVNGLEHIVRLNQRLMVIAPDECVGSIAETVGRSDIVIGIREAKGLEFPDVLLVDFFCNIPTTDQRHWKDLLSGGLSGGRGTKIAPQVESQLKMLYTAITRCCDRLIFAETRQSVAGSLFFRYLKSLQLAEPFVPSTSEMGVLTSDEWKQRGFDFASMVDPEEDDHSGKAQLLLTKAIGCFDEARLPHYRTAAYTHREYFRRMQFIRLGQAEGKRIHALDELESISLIGRCLSSGLIEEAKELCSQVMKGSDEESYVRQDIFRVISFGLKN